MKKQEDFDDFLINLGHTIRKYRDKADMTQEQLAKAVGSESEKNMRSYISKLENGQRNPPASVLKRIADILSIPPTQLLNEAMQIQEERKACELFEQCYGRKPYKIVKKFLVLDTVDQGKVEERIDVLLEDDKYQAKKESSKDVAI